MTSAKPGEREVWASGSVVVYQRVTGAFRIVDTDTHQSMLCDRRTLEAQLGFFLVKSLASMGVICY